MCFEIFTSNQSQCNIFKEEELEKSSIVANFATVQAEGGHEVERQIEYLTWIRYYYKFADLIVRMRLIKHISTNLILISRLLYQEALISIKSLNLEKHENQ